MLRHTFRLLYTIHTPRGINFALSADDAVQRIHKTYGSRTWLGAKTDYLSFDRVAKEFVPFYVCSGSIDAVYTATVAHSSGAVAGKDGSSSSTAYTTTSPLPLKSIFEENQTQIYAGYKYNISHVHVALRQEENIIRMKKMNAVDTSGATINLFEQSTSTMKEFVRQEVLRQARETAEAQVRAFHPAASSIDIHFDRFDMLIEEVTPVFVPCYVVKATYDGEQFTLYVSGMNGKVGGPYLPNALHIARATACAVMALQLLITPNKVAALLFGSVSSILAYYAAFYAARWYPSLRRDYARRQRYQMRSTQADANTSGFKPNTNSERIRQEYHSSSYWDGHRYQQRNTSSSSSQSSSSSGGARVIRDVKGYYRTLGLKGDESVNEIRSVYRQLVLQEHPDLGGSTEKMAKLNEAYRVLRDQRRREEYNAL